MNSFTIINTPGDGNCLFNAIAASLDNGLDGRGVRKSVVDWIGQNATEKNSMGIALTGECQLGDLNKNIQRHIEFIESQMKREQLRSSCSKRKIRKYRNLKRCLKKIPFQKKLDTYCLKMASDGAWGSFNELYAASQCFNAIITIYQREECKLIKCYDPIFPENRNDETTKIRLLYNGVDHYRALIKYSKKEDGAS